MKLIKILIVVLFLASCDTFSESKTKEELETDVALSAVEMNTSYLSAKDTLDFRYRIALDKAKDSTIKENLKLCYFAANRTLNYLDSLRIETQKLGDSDNHVIKKSFLDEGLADSIFNKVIIVYSDIEKVAPTNEIKALIKESRLNMLGEPNINQRKSQYFGLNTGLGASMIIYGIEMELLNVGSTTLGAYK